MHWVSLGVWRRPYSFHQVFPWLLCTSAAIRGLAGIGVRWVALVARQRSTFLTASCCCLPQLVKLQQYPRLLDIIDPPGNPSSAIRMQIRFLRANKLGKLLRKMVR